jgi:predicted RND superfamily exporter protein
MPAAFSRLLFIVLVALAGWFGVSRLDFDVDPLSLLPQNLPGLEGTRLLRDLKSDQLIVTLQSEDAELLEVAADSLAEHLDSKKDLAASVKHQSLLQSDPEVIAETIAWLWRNAPPEKVTALKASLAPAKLPALLEKSREATANSLDLQNATLTGYDPFGIARIAMDMLGFSPLTSNDSPSDEFTSADGTLRLLFIQPPTEALADYRTVNAWLTKLKQDIRETWQKSDEALAKVHIGFTGDPAFQAEIATGMESDMRQSISAVTFIVGFLFWLLHRRIVPLFWLLLAILCANLLTLGAAGAIYGSLNVMSMGFAAILTGLIEDFGVIGLHAASEHPRESYAEIRRRVLPGVAWSAVTIAAIFAALGLSQLPGVAQLGMLAALGVLIGAAVMLLGFLPLGMKPYVVHASACETPAPRLGLTLQKTFTWLLAALLLAATAAILIKGLPQADFGSSVLRPKQSEAFDISEQIEAKMIASDQTVPLLIHAANTDQLRQTLAEASKLLASIPHTLPTALIPHSTHQHSNTPALQQLSASEKSLQTALDTAGFTETAFSLTQKVLAQWRLDQRTTPEALSSALSQQSDGSWVLLGSVKLHEELNPKTALRDKFCHLDQPAPGHLLHALEAIPGVHPAGWNYLRVSLEPLLQREITRVCLPTAGIALVLFFLVFHGARERLYAAGVLLASAWVLLGSMAAFGWTWNLMSIGAVPLCLGLGLDFTIHMMHTLREKGSTAAHAASLGRSLAYCGLSTGLAFGSLALGSNRGLISLGCITMTGVITVLLTSSFALPYVWFRRNGTE